MAITVNLWEDDYCQIEVQPIANWDFCVQEAQKIDAFSEQHSAPNGLGWTDIYIRKTPSEIAKLEDLQITTQSLRNVLAKTLPKIDFVRYQTNEPKACGDAYGFGNGAVVYLESNDQEMLRVLWLDLTGPDESKRQGLMSALHQIATTLGHNFLLVDWGWSQVIRLDDEQGLDHYLRTREEHFNRANQKIKDARTETSSKSKSWWQFWKN